MKRFLRSTVLTGIILVPLLILAINAQAQDNTLSPPATNVGDPQVVRNRATSSIMSSAEEQALAYSMWTKEAMANAQAYDLQYGREIVDPKSSAVFNVSALPPQILGEAMYVGSPGEADAGAEASARLAYQEDWAIIEEAALAYEDKDVINDADSIQGTSSTYTRYELNRYTAFYTSYPYRTIGRLNFTTWDGLSSYCTASVMGPKNIVVTAAHCIYDTAANRWQSNWTFVPAYRNGSAPYGSFPYTTCRILNAWINQPYYSVTGAARYDMAICTMANNSSGSSLSSTVGWLGLRYPTPDENIHGIGYPQKYWNGNFVPYATRYTQLCTAETRLYRWDLLSWGCSLAQGMSGGPAIYRYYPFNVLGWVNSVFSGGYSGSNNSYGPRFKSSNIGKICSDHGGCW